MSKQIMPIGKDNFAKIREDNYYYVDKTLLIKQIIDAGAEVLRYRAACKSAEIRHLRFR